MDSAQLGPASHFAGLSLGDAVLSLGDVLRSQIPAPEESDEEAVEAEVVTAIEPLASPTADDKKSAAASGDTKAASNLPELLKVSRCHSSRARDRFCGFAGCRRCLLPAFPRDGSVWTPADDNESLHITAPGALSGSVLRLSPFEPRRPPVETLSCRVPAAADDGEVRRQDGSGRRADEADPGGHRWPA